MSHCTPSAARTGLRMGKALFVSLASIVSFGASTTLPAAPPADPGFIAYWDPSKFQTSTTSPLELPAWSHNPNTTVGDLIPHGGLTRAGANVALAYINWDTAINPNKYVGFTVTPKPGETLVVTKLGFGYYADDDQLNPSNATYQWRYRINEGSGYDDWVISAPFPVGDEYKIWTFPTPITTSGTVEFGYFSTAPTATTPASVSFGGSASPVFPGLYLYGTAGDVSPPTQGVISRYTRAATYTGNGVGTAREASTIAYNWDTDNLYSLDDETAGIQELSKRGRPLSGMGMGAINFLDTGLKGDPEALAYIGGGKFMIGAERQNVSMILTYVPNGSNEPHWMRTTPDIVWGPINGNVGLEGVSYDSTDGTFWGIKERDPIRVIHATGVGTGNVVLTDMDLNEINWRLRPIGFSDIFVMANSDAYANSEHILLLERDSRKIIEVTKTGQVVDVLDISHIGRSTIEGITMDNDGVIYLCSEYSNSTGDARRTSSAMHVLTQPKNPVTTIVGSGRGAVAAGTAAADEIYGTSLSETFTGGAGADTFVFKTLRDGVDTVTDFNADEDFIDVSALLAAVGYVGESTSSYDPLGISKLPANSGVIRVVESGGNAVLQIKSGTSYRSFAVLQGRTTAQAANPSNFIFITSMAAPTP